MTLQMLRREILLIDDQKDEREVFFREILERQGFNLKWCQNWKEVQDSFMARLKRNEPIPDLIMVDMRFDPPHNLLGDNPATEGVRIVQSLSLLFQSHRLNVPPIIGFTGHEDYMDRQEMIEVGVCDFVTAAEFQDTSILRKRILQCIHEAQIKRVLAPPTIEDVEAIENKIVRRALLLTDYNSKQAARLLEWPIEEIRVIRKRLERRGNS
jgi:DNA-binding NtrC family response regulator